MNHLTSRICSALRRAGLLAALVTGLLANSPSAPAWRSNEPTLHLKVGFDTNPLAIEGPATAPLHGEDSAVFTAGLALSANRATPVTPVSAKLAYAAETVRFEDMPEESYTSHRVSFAGQTSAADWHLAGEGSVLLIHGSRDTLAAISACNGNATTLWRERRAQWQQRAKASAYRDFKHIRLRVLTQALNYDYRTRTQTGSVAFADRADAVIGADLGWRPSARSLWFAGLRRGAQWQDTVPLPGGNFEYSNRYTRALVGVEGKLARDTTIAFAAGPDFRRYHGAIDPRVFGSRHRTIGWFETSATTKLSPRWTLTGKAARWAWLSSTGKSAYNDLAGEVSLAFAPTKSVVWNLSAKAHQCSYFPAARNDWEFLGSTGLAWSLTSRWQLNADLLLHRGWNELSGTHDRQFDRAVVSAGAVFKL